MKQLTLSLFMLALLSFDTTTTFKLKNYERKFAEKELTKSRDNLNNALKELSFAQLNYKSSPKSWSVAQCTEHIAIAEGLFLGMIQKAVKVPANPDKHSLVKFTDAEVMAIMHDRTNKVKTQEALKPLGKKGTHSAILKGFLKKRGTNINYILNTNDDLRSHYIKMPFGTIDAFQLLLFMTAHTDRHVAQINEVMENEQFPVK